MKILHITAAPISLNSGITSVLMNLTEEQNKLPHTRAEVLSMADHCESLTFDYFVHYSKKDEIMDYLDSYEPDVAIIHGFFRVQYYKMAKYLKEKNIPYMIEPHGSFGKQAMQKSWLKKKVANATIFRFLIKDAIGYIFTNKAEIKDSIYRTANDCIIPNGIVASTIKQISLDRKNNETPCFYFLGRYDINHKGLDYLFDALDILEEQKYNVKVNLYGIGNEEQNEYVKNRISKYKNLIVVDNGTIYGQAKVDALTSDNILILTSRYEGSPMTVLDALSFGNPCLVTPGTNVADEIVANGLGWSTELNAEKIADTILLAQKEYMRSQDNYVTKCRNYVLDNCSWARMAKLSVEIYADILVNYK